MICGVKTMVINENCKVCQIKRNIDKYPLNATEEEIKEAYEAVDPALIDVIRKALVNTNIK